MIIRDIEKPLDIILEARYILSERFKMFFSFLFFNAVGCLIVNFLDHVNNPYLCFCGLVLGCYLLYDLKIRQEHYYKSAKSLKFDSVSELEKDLNMEVTNDEWENIKNINEKLKMFFNVENVSIIFLLVSYLIVGMRVTLSLIDNHGVLK